MLALNNKSCSAGFTSISYVRVLGQKKKNLKMKIFLLSFLSFESRNVGKKCQHLVSEN